MENAPIFKKTIYSYALQLNSNNIMFRYNYLFILFYYYRASLIAQLVKNPPAVQETWIQFLGQEDPLEKGKVTHSSILAWRILWTVESMGSQRVRHD